MASGLITSWQIDGETVETVTDFFCGGSSKITADGDCSHEIKRLLLLGAVLTQLHSPVSLVSLTVWGKTKEKINTIFCVHK